MSSYFNRDAFAAAAKSAGKSFQQKARISEEGYFLCEVRGLKENYGANGNFFIAELEVVRSSSEAGQQYVGKTVDFIVDLTADTEFTQRDYRKIIDICLVSEGMPTDVTIESDEDLDQFQALKDSLLTGLSCVPRKESAVKGREAGGRAKGAIIGIRAKHKKKHEAGGFCNLYIYAPYLPAGATVDSEDLTKVVLADGDRVSRKEACIQAAK